MSALDTIKSQIEENSVLLYMKGTPNQPQCGFSSQTVQALMACGRPFSFVNILEHPDIRAELPAYAEWPTFPQLWIKGELIGGCDIVLRCINPANLSRWWKRLPRSFCVIHDLSTAGFKGLWRTVAPSSFACFFISSPRSAVINAHSIFPRRALRTAIISIPRASSSR